MPVTQGFHVEQHILMNIPGGDEIPVNGVGEPAVRHGFRRRDNRLRNHLAAVHASGGEVQAFAIDIRVVTMR